MKPFIAKTVYTNIVTGRKADWYIHDNAKECYNKWKAENPKKDDVFASAYFAQVGWYNKYADYMHNGWEGGIVAGPYLTEEEALETARKVCDKENEEYEKYWS